MYIDTILAHHGLAPAVLEVHSNQAEWRGGALRVAPYHTAPHGCRHCPSNLCKGQVGGAAAGEGEGGGGLGMHRMEIPHSRSTEACEATECWSE